MLVVALDADWQEPMVAVQGSPSVLCSQCQLVLGISQQADQYGPEQNLLFFFLVRHVVQSPPADCASTKPDQAMQLLPVAVMQRQQLLPRIMI